MDQETILWYFLAMAMPLVWLQIASWGLHSLLPFLCVLVSFIHLTPTFEMPAQNTLGHIFRPSSRYVDGQYSQKEVLSASQSLFTS